MAIMYISQLLIVIQIFGAEEIRAFKSCFFKTFTKNIYYISIFQISLNFSVCFL